MKSKHKSHFPTKLLFLLIILFAGLYVVTSHKISLPTFSLPKNPATVSPPPTPQPSPTPSPNPQIEGHHCIDEQEFSHITGANYVLIRENLLTEVNVLECEYEADSDVRGITPAIHYIYKFTDQTSWQTIHDEIAKKSSYRRIEGKEYVAADVNPVTEVSQATFYGYQNQVEVDLTYTPVDSEVGVLLDKGVQLIDKIFEKG